MRLTLVAAAILAASAAWAVSPYDLFFRSESDAMMLGGGDVPGEITGRADLDRPTSLLTADRPIVRLDLCSQTPLELSGESGSLGRWRSEVATLTYINPLGERWAVGVQAETVDDSIAHTDGPDHYRIGLDEQAYSVAGACRLSRNWTAAATLRWGDLSGSARGSSLPDLLSLPADRMRFPTLQLDEHSLTLAAGYESGDWQAGALWGRSEPDATLHVTRATYDYSAPMDQQADRYELWASHRSGADQCWALMRDMQSDGDGTIFLGAGGRGDTSLSLGDQTLSVGWRREGERSVTQVQFDRRDSDFATYDQGYAGLLPGISSEIHTLRASGSARIASLRVGHERQVARDWWVSLAGAAQLAEVEEDMVIRRVPGLAWPSVIEAESHVDGGELRLWSLTLGVAHESDDLRVALTGTAGFAETNSAFDDAIEGGGTGADGEHRTLDVRPLFTLSAEWRR